MRRREKLKRGGIRFSKFTAVGAMNAAVDIGALNLLLWLEPTRVPWQIALYNGVALVLANLNSYVWNSQWTFRGRSRHGLWQGLAFTGQALVNIGISSGLFWLLVRPILLHTEVPTYLAGNAAKVVSVAVASVVSYFLMRYVVFSRWRPFKGRL
ncbi:MAG: GtrA family protein [Rubrobacter sp.]|nr:GtrA family protein [Rubrobacter sp.]